MFRLVGVFHDSTSGQTSIMARLVKRDSLAPVEVEVVEVGTRTDS